MVYFNSVSRTVPTTSSKGTVSEQKIDALENELERVYMITEALWRIVQEKFRLDDEDLTKLLYVIDMRDGRQDGRVARQGPRTCSACGRAVARRHSHCIYCGEFIQISPFER